MVHTFYFFIIIIIAHQIKMAKIQIYKHAYSYIQIEFIQIEPVFLQKHKIEEQRVWHFVSKKKQISSTHFLDM